MHLLHPLNILTLGHARKNAYIQHLEHHTSNQRQALLTKQSNLEKQAEHISHQNRVISNLQYVLYHRTVYLNQALTELGRLIDLHEQQEPPSN